MSNKNKVNAKKLVEKIEKLTKERISKEKVVSLKDYRNLKKKKKEKLNILIVEDNNIMREALKKIFESQGYSVFPVADVTEISRVLSDVVLDLIILDIGLPWVNGLELAKLIKQSDELKDIPLIFISGRGSEQDIKLGFQAGADDYIRKPFDVDHVCKTVRVLLKLSG